MTKKDYIKIVAVIKKEIDRSKSNKTDQDYLNGRYDATRDTALDLAVVFASDNPRFDQDRFLEACGL